MTQQTFLVELREPSAWFFNREPASLSLSSRNHIRLGSHVLPLRTLRAARGLGRDEYVLTSGARLVLTIRPARSAPADWAGTLALLRVAPPYTLIKELGRGAFGVVHSARRRDGSLVAVKRVSKDALRRSREAYHAARREGILARTLPRHPNIIKVLDARESRSYFLTVMELVEGGSLLDKVREGPMSEEAIVHVIRQLLAAIAHMHSNGIVHRDVKLENVLVEDGNAELPTLKLCDLGLAIGEDALSTESAQGSRAGTGYAQAPEIVLQGAGVYGRQIDVWACGIVLFAMLYRRVPWTDDTTERQVQMDVMRQLSREMQPSIQALQTKDERIQTPRLLHSLLSGLLHPDPKCRLSARAALEHPVFDAASSSTLNVVANCASTPSLSAQMRPLILRKSPSLKRLAMMIVDVIRVIESLQRQKVGSVSRSVVVL